MPAHIAALPRGRRSDSGPPGFTAGGAPPGISGTGGQRGSQLRQGGGAPRDVGHRRVWWESSDAVAVGGMQVALDPYTPGVELRSPRRRRISRAGSVRPIRTPRALKNLRGPSSAAMMISTPSMPLSFGPLAGSARAGPEGCSAGGDAGAERGVAGGIVEALFCLDHLCAVGPPYFVNQVVQRNASGPSRSAASRHARRHPIEPFHRESWSVGRGGAGRCGRRPSEAVGRIGPVLVEMCISLSRGAFRPRDVQLEVPARVQNAHLDAQGRGGPARRPG